MNDAPTSGAALRRRMTVGIVTYARTPICVEAIAAVLPLLGPEDEFVVVEQGASDVAVYCQARWPGRVLCFTLGKPSMVGARNYLIQRARGEVILFIDDDVVPSPKLIEAHWAAYRDSSIGGVAGRILSKESDPALAPELPGTHWMGTNFEATSSAEVPHARGCNMSFRREGLVKIGGFDPGHLLFRDDSDMCFRLRAEGYRILFVPEAELLHLAAESGGTRGASMIASSPVATELKMYHSHFRHYRDNLYFLVKHFRGIERWTSIARAHHDYVGLSRWPWRLAAKNLCFLAALLSAFWTKWTRKPPYFQHKPAANSSPPNEAALVGDARPLKATAV
jgi:GT2 family glycosyltransferase